MALFLLSNFVHVDQNLQCFLLLLYTEVNMVRLSQLVQKLDLYVDVAFLGRHLQSYVYNQSAHHKPTLLFDWVPNTLTAFNNYTRVKLPPCHSRGASEACDFEIHQMSKVQAGYDLDLGGWDGVGRATTLSGRLGQCWQGDCVARQAGVVLAG